MPLDGLFKFVREFDNRAETAVRARNLLIDSFPVFAHEFGNRAVAEEGKKSAS